MPKPPYGKFAVVASAVVAFAVVAAICGAFLAGCKAADKPLDARPERAAATATPAATAAVSTAPAVTSPVSVNALMVALIDNSSHVLWHVEETGGTPKTDRDWLELQDHATQLAAAGAVIALDGPPQSEGWAKLPGWSARARELTDAGLAALAAVHNRDLQALVKANSALAESCQDCHEKFKPTLPSEGINHTHPRPRP